MTETGQQKRNLAPWWALLCALASLGCNVAFFAAPPLQGLLPWLSLVFDVLAVVFLIIGLRRAFGQPQIYRGKTLAVVLTIVTVLPVGLTVFGFVMSRKMPNANTAPQVGQRAPDFTLADTSGKSVSLDQLLDAAPGATAPKAVLLIFYRGYW